MRFYFRAVSEPEVAMCPHDGGAKEDGDRNLQFFDDGQEIVIACMSVVEGDDDGFIRQAFSMMHGIEIVIETYNIVVPL